MAKTKEQDAIEDVTAQVANMLKILIRNAQAKGAVFGFEKSEDDKNFIIVRKCLPSAANPEAAAMNLASFLCPVNAIAPNKVGGITNEALKRVAIELNLLAGEPEVEKDPVQELTDKVVEHLKPIVEEAMARGIKFEFKKAGGKGVSYESGGARAYKLYDTAMNLVNVFTAYSNVNVTAKTRVAAANRACFRVATELNLFI